MFLKVHISGDAVVYDSKPPKKNLFPNENPHHEAGRPQGSLYSQQKRKIADACEYLRLSLQGNKERVALVFTLTTPGLNNLADAPRFVSAWFENMRANYSMGEYVWVREYTKKGYPHFHCVADWFSSDYFFFEQDGQSKIKAISQVWSAHFGSDSDNSVWLGGYWFGKRIYSLRSKAQCRYLTKYLGKGFTVKPRPLKSGVLKFDRITDVQELLQSVRNSLDLARQRNLNQRSQRRKPKSKMS